MLISRSRISRSLSSGRPKAGPGGSIRATRPRITGTRSRRRLRRRPYFIFLGECAAIRCARSTNAARAAASSMAKKAFMRSRPSRVSASGANGTMSRAGAPPAVHFRRQVATARHYIHCHSRGASPPRSRDKTSQLTYLENYRTKTSQFPRERPMSRFACQVSFQPLIGRIPPTFSQRKSPSPPSPASRGGVGEAD